jgi:hypothetical protein
MANPRRTAATWIKEIVEAATSGSPVYGVTVLESIHAPLTPRVEDQWEFIRPFYLIDSSVTPNADGTPVYKDVVLALAAYVRIMATDKRERLDEQDRADEIMREIFRLIFASEQAGTRPAGFCRWYVAGCGEATDSIKGDPYAVMSFALVINPTLAGVDWRRALKAAGALP